ncbi:hypothetical protein FOBRF1_013122 [Fusarium oxysporum]
MPPRRVKDSERRRCVRACRACKRRKERCSGAQPCERCLRRSVGHECVFEGAQRWPSEDQTGATSSYRVFDWHCPSPPSDVLDASSHLPQNRDRDSLREPSPSSCSATPLYQTYRLLPSDQGQILFLGSSSTLSFLDTIQRLVHRSPWASFFVGDLLQYSIVEAAPPDQSDWILETAKHPPELPTLEEARNLLRWYKLATNCILHLFTAPELNDLVSIHLHDARGSSQQRETSASLYLIFAIGAQACPEDRDESAERFFNYGRLLAMRNSKDLGIPAIQAHILITMYLLGASRRNAAFVSLGTAVRAAYALGTDRRDVNACFSESEYASRERIWKVLRVLDMSMSAYLGRSPSTRETRDIKPDHAEYSATNNISLMFEDVLSQVYSDQVSTAGSTQKTCRCIRQWTLEFAKGLAADEIQPDDFIDHDLGITVPNIGLIHLKEAYYVTIMLLTRPFLIKCVAEYLSNMSPGSDLSKQVGVLPSEDRIFELAGVDAAVRTVNLISGLMTAEYVPKRLPFVVNSLFCAGLVLGLAQFGDLDGIFPLKKSLAKAQKLLFFFGKHDVVAQREGFVIKNLEDACDLYLDQRARRRMAKHSSISDGIFGIVQDIGQPPADITGQLPHQSTFHTPESFIRGFVSGQVEETPPCVERLGQSSGQDMDAHAQIDTDLPDPDLNVLPCPSVATDTLPANLSCVDFDFFSIQTPLTTRIDTVHEATWG